MAENYIQINYRGKVFDEASRIKNSSFAYFLILSHFSFSILVSANFEKIMLSDDSFRFDPAKRKVVRFRIYNLEVRNFYGDIERFNVGDLIRSRRGVQQIIEIENNVFISMDSDPFSRFLCQNCFTKSMPRTKGYFYFIF